MRKILLEFCLIISFFLSLILANPTAVVINEIMYNPAQCSDNYCEWVEVYNPTNESVNLTGWKICDKTLLSGYINHSDGNLYQNVTLIISPQEYAIITDGGTGTEVYDNFNVSSNSVALHVSGSSICGGLNNDGDTVNLSDVAGNMIDSITYSDSWNPKGDGYSLERINPLENSNSSVNWNSSKEQGGTPGRKNSILANDSTTTTTTTMTTMTSTTSTTIPSTTITTTTMMTTTTSIISTTTTTSTTSTSTSASTTTTTIPTTYHCYTNEDCNETLYCGEEIQGVCIQQTRIQHKPPIIVEYIYECDYSKFPLKYPNLEKYCEDLNPCIYTIDDVNQLAICESVMTTTTATVTKFWPRRHRTTTTSTITTLMTKTTLKTTLVTTPLITTTSLITTTTHATTSPTTIIRKITTTTILTYTTNLPLKTTATTSTLLKSPGGIIGNVIKTLGKRTRIIEVMFILLLAVLTFLYISYHIKRENKREKMKKQNDNDIIS
jgi:hypothetical protein